jgi:hypothetical protein
MEEEDEDDFGFDVEEEDDLSAPDCDETIDE